MHDSLIRNLLTENRHTNRYFAGVFPSDTLEENVNTYYGREKSYFVVNFDPSHEPGSHWVAMIVNAKPPSEYFDSYGLPPPRNLSFDKILKNGYIFNTVQLQSPFTAVCGQYCIHYLLQRSRGFQMKEIVGDFTNDLVINDVAVNSAVEEAFNTDLKVVDKELIANALQRSRPK